MRRVVVTGLGLVTPLGADVETAWANIVAARSGAATITRFDATDFHTNYACEVKPVGHEWAFDPNLRVDHKVQRQVDPFIIYGIDAAGQALEDAGLTEMSEAERFRAGCSIGAGIGGLPGIESESLILAAKGPKRVSPHFVHGRLINLITGQVQIKYGLMGPNHAVVTACSTIRPRAVGRMTATATASSWARARASSAWRNTSGPGRVAPPSMPR